MAANSTLSVLLTVQSERILGNGTHLGNDARENGCSESRIPVTGSGQDNSVGGYAAGGIGPTAEGIVAFVVGLTAMIGIAIWLGAKA